MRPLLTLLLIVVLGVGLGLTAYLVFPSITGDRPTPAAPPIPVAPPAPTAPLALYGGRRQVAVLMYHDIVEKRKDVYFDVTLRELTRDIQRLRKAGAEFVSLGQVYDHLHTGVPLPDHPVLLTFDDGYAGQLRLAYPLLKAQQIPATFFVPTGTVGVTTSKEHMTWDELRRLDQEGLVSIEAHTITHPEDLRLLGDLSLEKELVESKRALEERLGRRVRFLAYPVGNADARVARFTHEAGYEMAFTMGPGWAASPEDALFVPRFSPARLDEVVSGMTASPPVFAATSQILDVEPSDLECGSLEDGIVHLRWLSGGRLLSLRLNGRRDVPTIVGEAHAVGGLNGTFFSDARVNSAGAGIVGPIMNRFGPDFAPGLPGDRERIAGRPFVIIAGKQMAFIPFRPSLALDADAVQRLMPAATDCFVGGAWLVHEGRALTHDEIASFSLSNVFDFRPRAFMGINGQGRPFLGATSTGNQSDRVAETLEKLGIRECVLLDSGFSTSLTVGKSVLVTGLMRRDIPARPVPHALLLYPVDAESGEEMAVLDYPAKRTAVVPHRPTMDDLAIKLKEGIPPVPGMDENYDPATQPRRRKRRHRRR